MKKTGVEKKKKCSIIKRRWLARFIGRAAIPHFI
jgi:hypothetical protein